MQLKPLLIVVLLLGLLGIGFQLHRDTFEQLPIGIHAWAQADRLAIADGFINNGFKFHLPETYTYNKQNPHWWEFAYDNTITAANFPIHQYLIAFISHGANINTALVFRAYVFFFSVIGLIFIFLSSYKVCNNLALSFLVTAFTIFSPVFLAYQNNYLPLVANWAIAAGGIYFYIKYFYSGFTKGFYLSVFLLTLATIGRTTFIIPFLAILGNEFYRRRKYLIINKKLLVIILSTLGILIIHEVYNRYLLQYYGSVFMNNLRPVESINDFFLTLPVIWKHWGLNYYTASHYVVLILSSVMAVFLSFKKFFRRDTPFLPFFIIYLGGLFLFTLAMFQQFIHHDYYFLDTYFLFFSVLLIFCLKQIVPIINRSSSFIQFLVSGIIIIFFYLGGNQILTERRNLPAEDFSFKSYQAYNQSDGWLDSLGIAKNARIMALHPPGPNFPFVFMKRKGYALMASIPERMEKLLTWPYDYIVVPKEQFKANQAMYRKLQGRFRILSENEKLYLLDYDLN